MNEWEKRLIGVKYDILMQAMQAGRASTPTRPTLLQQIAMRLRLPESGRLPFDFINAHAIDNDRVVVFLVTKNHTGDVTPLMIEDDGNLFPSDVLVTQLRLLIEK